MPHRPGRIALFLLALLALAPLGFAPDSGEEGSRRADQEALKAYAPLVGDWKGTGQPRRSSVRDAWREAASWSWTLSPRSAALALSIEDGKYLRSARLEPGRDRDSFRLVATLADGSTRTYSGTPTDRGALPLSAEGEAGEGVRRITLTPLHDTRFLLLLEGQDATSGLHRRLAEVGYTRQGSAFAAGDSYPVCIVTGGRGTIEVEHEGTTYYVCCSGCRDLFDDDPAAIIAEANSKAKAGGP